MATGSMFYTPQQQMGHEGYSVPCRIGNWAEDEYLKAAHTHEFMQKASSGLLSSTKLASTIGVATSAVELAPPHPDGLLRFGDTVMLSSALGGALCGNTNDRLQLNQEAYQVSRANLAEPQQRSCWTIVPAGNGTPEDGLLRYGEPFQLIAGRSPSSEPLFLQGQRSTLLNGSYSGSICGAERKHCVCLAYAPSYMTTQWMATPLNPNPVEQLALDKQPIPANTFVSITHLGTRIKLCSDDHKERNKFGVEMGVSLFTDADIAKAAWGSREGKGCGALNHFAFTTGVADSNGAHE